MLEEARRRPVYATGMAAVSGILLALLKSGDHVVLSDVIEDALQLRSGARRSRHGLELPWHLNSRGGKGRRFGLHPDGHSRRRESHTQADGY